MEENKEVVVLDTFLDLKDFIENMEEGVIASLEIKVVVNNG